TCEGNMITIVDDDESVRQATKTLLRSAGYQVGTFDSAELFLGSDASAQTDCLILDVRMPGMDGLALQRHLNTRSSRVPIIFITAHDDPARRYQALSAGAADFLRKPFEANALLAAVQSSLNREKERLEIGE